MINEKMQMEWHEYKQLCKTMTLQKKKKKKKKNHICNINIKCPFD